MSRPCQCGNAEAGGPFGAGQCWDCWRWANSAWWRERWTTGKAPARQPRRVGYGDLVAWAAGKLGIKQCGGCSRRRKALNKLPTPADLWRTVRGGGE